MLMMSHLRAEIALLARLGRDTQSARSSASSTPEPPLAGADPTARSTAPAAAAALAAAQPCSERWAIHDLAALKAGTLDVDSRRKLAQHIAGCPSCKALLATLIAERQQVESTGG